MSKDYVDDLDGFIRDHYKVMTDKTMAWSWGTNTSYLAVKYRRLKMGLKRTHEEIVFGIKNR